MDEMQEEKITAKTCLECGLCCLAATNPWDPKQGFAPLRRESVKCSIYSRRPHVCEHGVHPGDWKCRALRKDLLKREATN